MRYNFKVGHIEPFLVSIICKPSVSWPPRQAKPRLDSCTKYCQSLYCVPGESGCKLLGPCGSHKANERIGRETRATESFLKKIKAGLRTMEHGGAAVRADYCENRAFGSEAWTMTS